jgi:hypothetical protein
MEVKTKKLFVAGLPKDDAEGRRTELEEKIKSSDPLLLAHEFFSPLFFYQMQVILLKLDKKSTSSVVSMFEKHVNMFWDNIKIEYQETLF